MQYRDKMDELEVLTVRIDEPDFEGECSVIVPNLECGLDFSIIRELFDYESFDIDDSDAEFSAIDMCQKGVLVSSYGCDILRFTIGQVNIKRSIAININRNEFKNDLDVDRILYRFGVDLLKLIFDRLRPIVYNDEDKIKHSNQIMEQYIGGDYFRRIHEIKQELNEVLRQNIWLKIFDKGRELCLSIDTLLKQYSTFIFLPLSESQPEVIEQLDCPCVIADDSISHRSQGLLKKIFMKLMDCEERIVFINDLAYLQVSKDKIEDQELDKKLAVLEKKSGYEVSDIVAFENSNKVATSMFLNKPQSKEFGTYLGDGVININHQFVQHVLREISIYQSDTDSSRILREAFELIITVTHGRKEISEGIRQLNRIIKPLYEDGNNYVFKKKDFYTPNKKTS